MKQLATLPTLWPLSDGGLKKAKNIGSSEILLDHIGVKAGCSRFSEGKMSCFWKKDIVPMQFQKTPGQQMSGIPQQLMITKSLRKAAQNRAKLGKAQIFHLLS